MKPIVIEPKAKAKACVIWMHGLGAGAEDMAGLAEQLPIHSPVKHVSLAAPIRPITINQHMPMPAWYDITGITLNDREDKAGILESEALILKAIDAVRSEGFEDKQIFLAGFSQGGAMALFTALNTLKNIGGVIALSAYLPLREALSEITLTQETPIFMGSGRVDDVVRPEWTKATAVWLHERGYEKLTIRDYMMAHQVCLEEIQDVAIWLDAEIESKVSSVEKGVS